MLTQPDIGRVVWERTVSTAGLPAWMNFMTLSEDSS